jgi:hypothetical protein
VKTFVISFYFGSGTKSGSGTESEMHSGSGSAKAKISGSDRFRFDNIGHERRYSFQSFYPSRLATVYMEVDTDLSLLVCPALARVGDGENVTRRGGDLADASPTRRVFQPHCTMFHSTFFTKSAKTAKEQNFLCCYIALLRLRV